MIDTSNFTLSDVTAVLPDRVAHDASIVVRVGVIVDVLERSLDGPEVVDGHRAICIPGIVDTHSHILSNFAFGGGGIFHGEAFHRLGVEHAMRDCETSHGEMGRKDFFGYAFDTDGSGDADLTGLGLTTRRVATIGALANAVATGEIDLDPIADRERTAAQLLALPGVGPWTVNVIRMRVLGDPDVLLANDLVIKRQLARLGATEKDHAQWSPWRSYVTAMLWAKVGRGEHEQSDDA